MTTEAEIREGVLVLLQGETLKVEQVSGEVALLVPHPPRWDVVAVQAKTEDLELAE